jgi:hypothetical protein
MTTPCPPQDDARDPLEVDRQFYDNVHVCLSKMDAVLTTYIFLDGESNPSMKGTLVTLGMVVDDYRAEIERRLDEWWEDKRS